MTILNRPLQFFFDLFELIMDPIKKALYRSDEQWFWVRECFHFTGGVLIGLSSVWSLWVYVGAGAVLLGVIIYKEVGEDLVTQPRKKTYIDCSAWALGFAVSALRFLVWPV